MLIPSERPTTQDMRLWREYSLVDESVSKDPTFLRHVEESLRFIEEFGECYVSMSWGKDSVAMAHLFLRANPGAILVHMRSVDSHNPHCDDVRDCYLGQWPGQRYEEVSLDYTLVDRDVDDDALDRETDRIWCATIRECKRRFGDRYATGIRSSESSGRRIRMMIHGSSSKNALAPIGFWSTNEVFAYLHLHDLPVHPSYACLGGGRYERNHIRVTELGDVNGRGMGRGEWEQCYYGDILNRMKCLRK